MNRAMSFSSSGHTYVGAQPPWGGVRPPIGLQISGNHNSSGKPPSWGAVRPLVGSETTGNQDSYGQPPSLTNVCRRSSSSDAELHAAGMSLTEITGNQDSYGQPPSWGHVRPLVGSETTGNQDSYGQPPSLTDVRGRQASHTSSSSDAELHAAGMSLTLDLFDFMKVDGGGANLHASGMRPLVGSETTGNQDSYGQPPSWGAVRPLVGSETIGNQDSYGQPPSLNDVRVPQASQTSSSFNQNQISGLTPSRIDVRQLVGSETTGNQDSYGINDVPVPQASHTSSSFKRKKISGAESQSGMSLTPSRVDVRPLVGSQTTGGTGNQDSYGKPLSFNEPNDVCEPQASQTSSLFKRNEISGAESQSDMSLTPYDMMMVDSGEEAVVDRPSCLVWTADLHKHFVEAVQRLDTMLQVVNVEGLTLEDVSSNLQRCKLSL